MTGPDIILETAITTALRRANEPVREASLYERVLAGGVDVTPHAFLAAVTRLETLGHIHLSVEHDGPAHDPAPFQPRYLRIIQ